jgi:tetratricopeptide (TPR) repeat protein
MAREKTVKAKPNAQKDNSKILYAIVFGFSFLLYSNSILNNYNLDDELVTRNHRLTKDGISAIPSIFKEPYYKDKGGYSYEYRPVVLISFAVEHSLFGENPHVSHFFNVLLYSLLCLLLFYVLTLLLNSYSIILPFLITIIFSAHPIHTEVVASIKNRDEIFSLTFSILALFFALSFVDTKKILWLILLPVAFVLSLLSKQTTNVFIVFIPVMLIVFRKICFKQAALVYVVLAVVAFPVMNISTVSGKLKIISAGFIFLCFVYLLVNNFLSAPALKKIVSDFFLKIKSAFQGELTEEKKEPGWFASPGKFAKPIFFVFYLLPSITLAALGFYGLYFHHIPLLYVSIVLLCALFFFAKHEGKTIVLPLLTAVLIATIFVGNLSEKILHYSILTLLSLTFFNSRGILKYVSLVLTLLVTCFFIFVLHDFRFLLIPLLYIGFYFKPIRFMRYAGIGIIVMSILLVLFKFTFRKHSDTDFLFFFLPLSVFVLFLHYKRAEIQKSILIVFAFITIGLALSWNKIYLPGNPVEIRNTVIALDRKNPVNINPDNVKRPLIYIENPVSISEPFSVQLGTAMDILLKYLRLIIEPYPMSFYYGYSYITAKSLTDFTALLGAVVYVGLFIVSIWLIRKYSVAGFGILFFIFCISCYTNIVMPVPGMMADRFLFIPSLGFSFVIAWVLLKFSKTDFAVANKNFTWNSSPANLRYATLCVLLFYSVLVISRNADWKDQLTLFKHDISTVENSAQAQNLLGLHLFIESINQQDANVQKQMREQAIIHFKKALEIYPKFLNASYDLGRVYESLQMPNEAFAQYQNTISIDTTFRAPCFSMAVILHNQGKAEEAIPYYERFLTKYPTQMEVYANLSYAYYSLRQFEKSIEINHRALAANPNSYEPIINIGKTYMQMNLPDSAIHYFEIGQQLKADNSIQAMLLKLKDKSSQPQPKR